MNPQLDLTVEPPVSEQEIKLKQMCAYYKTLCDKYRNKVWELQGSLIIVQKQAQRFANSIKVDKKLGIGAVKVRMKGGV